MECNYCKKLFQRMCLLRHHIEEEHSKESPQKISTIRPTESQRVVSETEASKETSSGNQPVAEPGASCSANSKVCSSKSRAPEKTDPKCGKHVFVLPQCVQEFASSNSALKTRRRERTFHCYRCEFSCKDYIALRCHVRKEHNMECIMDCGRIPFQSEDLISRHVEDKHSKKSSSLLPALAPAPESRVQISESEVSSTKLLGEAPRNVTVAGGLPGPSTHTVTAQDCANKSKGAVSTSLLSEALRNVTVRNVTVHGLPAPGTRTITAMDCFNAIIVDALRQPVQPVTKVHTMPSLCKYCFKECSSNDELRAHEATHQTVAVLPGPRTHTVIAQGPAYASSVALFCRHCRKKCSSNDELRAHEATHQTVTVLPGPRTHTVTAQRPAHATSMALYCRHCRKKCSSNDELRAHEAIHQTVTVLPGPRSQRPAYASSMALFCRHCRKEYSSYNELNAHIMEHGVSPRSGEGFSKISSKKEHILTHSDESHLKNNPCPKISSWRPDLSRQPFKGEPDPLVWRVPDHNMEVEVSGGERTFASTPRNVVLPSPSISTSENETAMNYTTHTETSKTPPSRTKLKKYKSVF